MAYTEYHVITRHWHHGVYGCMTNAVCATLSEAFSVFHAAINMEKSGIVVPVPSYYLFGCDPEKNNGLVELWGGNNTSEDYCVAITLVARETHDEN